jgi:hypothetical protein
MCMQCAGMAYELRHAVHFVAHEALLRFKAAIFQHLYGSYLQFQLVAV